MSPVHDTIRPVRYAWTALWLALLACSRTTAFETDRDLADAGLDAQIEDDAGLIDAGLALGEAGQAMCGPRLCACSNGEDDDGDGQRDGFDNECTGPFDDDELSFRVNDVREQSSPKCSDCFFDGNPGPGDDRCDVSSSCTFTGRPQSASTAARPSRPTDATASAAAKCSSRARPCPSAWSPPAAWR
jgi:hypothetical protein